MAARETRGRNAVNNSQAARLARGLGWLSVGMGVAQIVAPRAVCRIVGLPVAPALMRLSGLRELAGGIALITQRDPVPWLEARVAGDAVNLAGLAASAPMEDSDGRRISVAIAAVAGVTALDVYCARELSAKRKASPQHVRTTITVDAPPDRLYRFWRELQNLPRVMPHLKSVQALGGNRSHWVAAGPGGAPIEWDSEIIDDKPNVLLAWRSIEGSNLFNAGSVYFEPEAAGRGTFVTVELLYDPPAGTLIAAVAKLVGMDVGRKVRADLTAFKQLMETGEIAATQSQSSVRRG